MNGVFRSERSIDKKGEETMVRLTSARRSNVGPIGIAAGLAAALLCGASAEVQATAISTVTADACLSVTIGPTQGVEVLSFVSDDGQNPLTTFAFNDPDGILGSTASASGAVTGKTGNALCFEASNSTQAEGAPDPLIEIAWAQTTLGGGFLISNNSLDQDINATISVEWSWTMDLSADGSAVDLGLGQVSMELLIDGVSLNVPVDTLLTAPANGVYSDSGVFSTILNVPTQGSLEVSLGVFTLSLAQASVSAVPEPSTPYLFLAGAGLLVGAMARCRRRCSPQADSLEA